MPHLRWQLCLQSREHGGSGAPDMPGRPEPWAHAPRTTGTGARKQSPKGPEQLSELRLLPAPVRGFGEPHSEKHFPARSVYW